MNFTNRRQFLKQVNCAGVGTSAVLSTILNLQLADRLAGQEDEAGKSLVCLFLGGGMDSFNFLVPNDLERYAIYSTSRGRFGSSGGISLERSSLLPLASPIQDYGLHPACRGIHELATGTGRFAGKARLSFIANVGTLVQPLTKGEFIAWENGANTIPVPRALFSHSDQMEQWQTAVPQGMDKLSGWAGRSSDILNSIHNRSSLSMNISLSGNNLLQAGERTKPFVITPSGSLLFSGDQFQDSESLINLKNSGLRGLLDLQYSSLLSQAFSSSTRAGDEVQRQFQSEIQSDEGDLGGFVTSLFPQDPLSRSLRTVVQAIKIAGRLGMKRQTFFVNFGGWDHHGELLDTQDGMLRMLDASLTAFQRSLEVLGLADRVVTFSASDFGRSLRSNGRGSDHAWGGNAFVLGGPVNGGRIFGRYPSLELNGPDDIGRGGRFLPSTSVDLYFAELLRWFGVGSSDLAYVLPNIGNFYRTASENPPIGFLKQA